MAGAAEDGVGGLRRRPGVRGDEGAQRRGAPHRPLRAIPPVGRPCPPAVLPDVYTYVTHGRGILGSSGAYNKRHRRLCGPPFRSPALLRRFGDVVVER